MESDDLRQILAVLADYGRTLDGALWDDHLALYADDCHLLVFGKDHAGKERIARFMQQAHRGKHLTGVASVTFAGNSARATSDFVFFRQDLRLYSAGTYHDEFVRTEQGWRLSSRRIEIQMRAAD